MTNMFFDHSHIVDFDFGFEFQHQPRENYYDKNLELVSEHSSIQCLSTKNSYEYAQTSDFDGSDKFHDDERSSHLKSPTLVHKSIQKHHEPIIDNGHVYRYEDDPAEYKRARKRVQNRISATRVRNKKKTHVEELECQVSELKGEINQLKTTNNILTTENSLLKQQVSFFEKLFTNKQQAQQPVVDNALDTSVFSFNNDTELDIEPMEITRHNDSPLYFRSGPRGGLKRHTAFLGVMTVLLCMYGAFTAGEEMHLGNLKSEILGSNNQVSAFGITKIVTRSVENTQSQGELNINEEPPTNLYGWLILGSKMAFIIIYVLYAIYVLQKIHRYYFHNKASTL